MDAIAGWCVGGVMEVGERGREHLLNQFHRSCSAKTFLQFNNFTLRYLLLRVR
jgi:hypothetical protein